MRNHLGTALGDVGKRGLVQIRELVVRGNIVCRVVPDEIGGCRGQCRNTFRVLMPFQTGRGSRSGGIIVELGGFDDVVFGILGGFPFRHWGRRGGDPVCVDADWAGWR